MKKEVKHLGVSTTLVLMVMVLFGSLFSSCYTKDDIPVTPPIVSTDPATYTVNITVMDTDGALTGVTFYGMSTWSEVGAGKYTYTQTGAGDVTFTLSKAGYEDASYMVTLPTAKTGEKVTLSATFFMKKIKKEDDAKYTIAGRIFDGVTGVNIDAPTVTATLRGGVAETIAVTGGVFSHVVTTPGIYDFVIVQAGMNTVNYSVTLQKIPAGEEYFFNMEVPMYQEGTVEGMTYTLKGTITGTDGQPLNDVTMTYHNNDNAPVTMVVNGNYLISNLLKGDVTIYFQADGHDGYRANYDLSAFSAGTVIELPAALSATKAGSGSVVASPDQDVTLGVGAMDPITGASVAVKSLISVPAGALESMALIGAKIHGEVGHAVTGTVTDNSLVAATFATGQFTPAGLTFNQPITWSVENPFGVALNNLKLQYSQDGSVWADPEKDEDVVTADGSYHAQIHHFSHYRMVLEASNLKIDTSSTVLPLESFYLNNTGKNLAVGKGKFVYTAKAGFNYVTTVQQALTNAGIAGGHEELIAMIEQAITVLNGQSELGDVSIDGTNDIPVQPGYVYVAEGKQYFMTKTYTFQIDGKNVNVVVYVAKERVLKGRVEMYDASHHTHGGHITDGGAGGGSGE